MPKHLLRVTTALTLTAAMTFVGATGALSAAAAQKLAIVISVEADGTPTFDAGAPAPDAGGAGLDGGPSNGVVRTADQVTYRLDWSVNGLAGTNVVLRSQLPLGMTWTALPAVCLAGGTPVSSISGRQLVCNVGDQPGGSAGAVTAVAQLALVKNATVLPLTATVQTDQAAAVTSNQVSVVASAAPKVDVNFDQAGVGSVPGVVNPNTGETGIVFYFPLTVEVPGSGKGAEPLADQTLHLVDDLSGLPSSATLASSSWVPAPGNGYTTCGPNDQPIAGVPYGSIGAASIAIAVNSSVDSGTWTCVQSGSTIDVKIAGADLSPTSIPVRDSAVSRLAQGRSVIVAGNVGVWISDSQLIALLPGGAAPGVGSVGPNRIDWGAMPDGISGGAATGEDPSNNTRSAQFQYTVPGPGGDAFYTGALGLAHANEGHGDVTFVQPLSPFPGVPDYSPYVPTQTQSMHSGDGTVVPGEPFTLDVGFANEFDGPPLGQASCVQLSPGQTLTKIGTYVDMDYRTLGNLSAYLDGIPPVVTNPTSGGPVGDVVASNATRVTSSPFDFPTFAPISSDPVADGLEVIEYSTDVHTNDGDCTDARYTWSTTPPADLTKVTQIRVHTTELMTAAEQITNVFSLTALPQPVGSKIWVTASYQNWGTGGQFEPDSSWRKLDTPYDPALFCDPPTGNPNRTYNDCLTIAGPNLSISKAVSSGKTTGLAAGDTVEYTIRATANGDSSGSAEHFVVKDTLPAYLRWTGTASVAPTNGAKAGDSALEWDFGKVGLSQTKTIVIKATVLAGYAANSTITNTATLDADVDNGDGTLTALPEKSSSAQIQTGGTFAKVDVLKATSTPLIDQDADMSFGLTVTNSGVETDRGLSFIDVLPWNGDVRKPSTAAHGTMFLRSATGAGMTFLFTKAEPGSVSLDPDDASNSGAAATTTWCAEADFGTGDCPASMAEVTAIQFSQDSLEPGASAKVDITMGTDGNEPVDQYANNFGGRSRNIKLPVTSNVVLVKVRGEAVTPPVVKPPTVTDHNPPLPPVNWPALPDTGGPYVAALVGGFILIVAGAVLLVVRRSRTSSLPRRPSTSSGS